MELLALLFIAWIVCVAWACLKSDYKQFVEDETPDTDDDEMKDPDNWGT